MVGPTFAATQTISMPLEQMAPPSAVTAFGLRITCVTVQKIRMES